MTYYFLLQQSNQVSQILNIIRIPILNLLAYNIGSKFIGVSKLQNQTRQGFRVFFMKGNDARPLLQSYQTDFLNHVRADPYGHSFITYNSTELRRKVSNWKRALPWITPYYAIKSNPIEPLINDIVAGPYGTFDCASKGEIHLALRHGVSPSNIIYSNPVKEEKDLHYAENKGIEYTTADTIDELIKIQKYAPNMKILWRIAIQEENPEQMATLFSGKFGDDFTNLDQVQNRFEQIAKMNIKLHGLHFHCGSAVQGSDSFGKAIDLARECIRIGRQHNHTMEVLDIGGGFPSGDIHQNALEALKKTENDPLGYKMMAEPGRHFSSNTCHLMFRIMTKRIKSGKLCYHVNESLYHSFNCILMDGVSFENESDQFYGALDANSNPVSHNQQDWTSLFGMTCDGRDIIAQNIKMPNNLEVGDWICMGGMGSYTVGPKSKFNGMKSTSKIHRWEGELVPEQVPEGELVASLSRV